MPNLKDIRKRISTIKNTQKITSAMKMVAAAKLRRAQESAESARPYALKMDQVIGSLVSRVDSSAHPLIQPAEDYDKELVLVISSNRGLCGGYNTNLFRSLDKFFVAKKSAGIQVDLVTVGRKAHTYYRNRPPEIVKNFEEVIGNISYATAKELAKFGEKLFLDGTYGKVHLLFNEFVSPIEYNTELHALLPLSLDDLSVEDDSSEYIFEPSEETLLNHLIPAHIEVQVLRSLLEADASEQGARMAAMDSATNNANDMISSLTLQYNRARQAYITKELVEIVSGAEALKG